jgi:hypothetical protein
VPVLVRAFVPAGAAVVVGMDAAIERRRGEKIAAKGICNHPCAPAMGSSGKRAGCA